MQYTFRPIQQWPRPFTKNRRYSTFTASYSTTLKLLSKELENLAARNVVIQVALQPRDIRNDGLPRADARKPEHPGAIVSFDSKHGALSYACDEFLDWKDNLRGIALTLERLRLVDLYGVTKSGEQYTGWAQLPAPAGDVSTREGAARFLSEQSGIVVTAQNTNGEAVKRAYQAAARKLHPDVPGGSHEQFVKLTAARELLLKEAS